MPCILEMTLRSFLYNTNIVLCGCVFCVLTCVMNAVPPHIITISNFLPFRLTYISDLVGYLVQHGYQTAASDDATARGMKKVHI